MIHIIRTSFLMLCTHQILFIHWLQGFGPLIYLSKISLGKDVLDLTTTYNQLSWKQSVIQNLACIQPIQLIPSSTSTHPKIAIVELTILAPSTLTYIGKCHENKGSHANLNFHTLLHPSLHKKNQYLQLHHTKLIYTMVPGSNSVLANPMERSSLPGLGFLCRVLFSSSWFKGGLDLLFPPFEFKDFSARLYSSSHPKIISTNRIHRSKQHFYCLQDDWNCSIWS